MSGVADGWCTPSGPVDPDDPDEPISFPAHPIRPSRLWWPDSDLPQHVPMPINADGDGPADPDETVGVVCWCGQPDCREYERP